MVVAKLAAAVGWGVEGSAAVPFPLLCCVVLSLCCVVLSLFNADGMAVAASVSEL